MEIISTNQLTKEQYQDAKALIQLCKIEDGTRGVSFFENELNYYQDFPCFCLAYDENILVAFLSVFVADADECELYANTHPKYRGRGIFRSLYEKISKDLDEYGIFRVCFANEPCCKAGTIALEKLGATFQSSEYLLSYNMNLKPQPKGILSLQVVENEEKLLLESYRKNEKIGQVSVLIEKGVATIFGVEIIEKMRGRGYGVETLLLTICELQRRECCKIILHVSGSNEVAYRMYVNHGFVHVQQLDYWMIEK